MKVLIVGDTVPTPSNYQFFESGDAEKIFGSEIIKLISSADFSILNLETPLVDEPKPIKKSGPHLIAPTKCVLAIKNLGINLCSLSNNHILDHNADGLFSTIDTLEKFGIKHTGAGKNLENANKPFIFEKDGIKLGVYSICEHEFSFATENSAGANPFDPYETFDIIKQIKKNVDFLLVLFHGGKEFYRYCSPLLQKTCRKIVDSGADMVICQHSHCIGCQEDYNGKKILYGQGNFIFDSSNDEPWQTGLLVELEIQKSYFSTKYIPISKKENGVQIADELFAKKIMEDFFNRSEQIKNKEFMNNNFAAFAKEKFSSYVAIFTGKREKTFLYKAINKILKQKLRENNYTESQLLGLLNSMRCESHMEVALKGIQEKISANFQNIN